MQEKETSAPQAKSSPPGQLAAAMTLMWGGLLLSSLSILSKLNRISTTDPEPFGLQMALILNVIAVAIFAWYSLGLWRGHQAQRRATWVIAAGATVWLGIPVAEELGAGVGVNGLNYILVVAIAAMLLAARLLATGEVNAYMADRN